MLPGGTNADGIDNVILPVLADDVIWFDVPESAVTPAFVNVSVPPREALPPPDNPVPAVTVNVPVDRADVGILVRPEPEPLNVVAVKVPVLGLTEMLELASPPRFPVVALVNIG